MFVHESTACEYAHRLGCLRRNIGCRIKRLAQPLLQARNTNKRVFSVEKQMGAKHHWLFSSNIVQQLLGYASKPAVGPA